MGTLSFTGLFVLQALAQGYKFGFDIMDVTNLPHYELTAAGKAQLAVAESRYRAVSKLFPKRGRA